jgi:bacillithiol system protein YtxJ
MGFFSSNKTEANAAPWVDLNSEEQLDAALANNDQVTFIFKHSTRCSISTMAKSRFEREWSTPDYPFQLLYLDLLNHRDLSSKIAQQTGVQHESPQLIVVKNGKVVYANSHSAISAQESIQKASH